MCGQLRMIDRTRDGRANRASAWFSLNALNTWNWIVFYPQSQNEAFITK